MCFFIRQFPGRDLHAAVTENNGKSHSPNVINIDLDVERGRSQNLTKITLGELTDSIIAKDFSSNPFMPLRPTQYPPYRNPESISTTEHWNYNRRMQQQKEAQHPPLQQQPSSQPTHHSLKNSGPDRSTPDDRHIIRMAQPPSPRNKHLDVHKKHLDVPSPFHESAAPPASYHYPPAPPLTQNVSRPPPTSSSGHQFALDCYVKNRIAEAMRTEDEKRAEEIHEQQRRTPQQPPNASGHHNKDMDRTGTPADMDDDNATNATSSSSSSDHHPHHSHPGLINSQYPPPPVTTFAPTSYPYPFSALNVSATPSSLPPPLKSSNDSDSNNRPPQPPPAAEPKPLLSAQYEALSDED